MSSNQQQIISYADLSYIENALEKIGANVSEMNYELVTLSDKQDTLETELMKLANTLADFIEEDLKQKALQLAETRQGNLKQDLQIKFGYFAEVRRMATGIIQGVEIGVVGDDSLKLITEEVMIKSQGYWLAPALVALAAWVRNDKTVNQKALAEALKRDDYKTTLFFMLVMRRLSRNDASLKWLERYFMHQNPHNIDREFIVVLEAVTTGVFPPASRQLMMSNIKSWLDILKTGDMFIDEQKTQWVKFFEASGPLPDNNYPLLEKFSSNWYALETSLKEAKTHAKLITHFQEIFSSSGGFTKDIRTQLDEILKLLVTNFDDEELPLQEQVRLNELIIQMEGDKNAAQRIMDSEKHIFQEKVDFLQMLTNASFNPESSGATKATQALAVSISQPWIVEAHDVFAAESRRKIPQEVKIDLNGFKTNIKDGSEETDLLNQHNSYYKGILDKEMMKIDFPYAQTTIGAAILLMGIWMIVSEPSIFGFIALVIGGSIIWFGVDKYNKAKERVKDNIEETKRKSIEVLRGCVAETVDYRKEHSDEDANAEVLRKLLKSITPEDFSSLSQETARNII